MENLEKLKENIKTAHNDYLLNRNLKQGFFDKLKLAKLFNINLDTSMYESASSSRGFDYEILEFDVDKLRIKIYDAHTNTYHIAEGTSFEGEDAIKVKTIHNKSSFDYVYSRRVDEKDYEIEEIFPLGSELPKKSMATVYDGIYKLAFLKRVDNNEVTFGMECLKDFINKDGKKSDINILTRMFTRDENNNQRERTIVNYEDYINIDRYTYINDGKVILGLNNFSQDGICDCVRGVCIPEIDGNIDEYLPNCTDKKYFKMFDEEGLKSGIVFTGFTKFYTRNTVEVRKVDHLLSAKYEIKHNVRSKARPDVSDTISIKNCSEGPVKSEEVLGLAVDFDFNKDDFLAVMVSIIYKWVGTMDRLKDPNYLGLDILSPKLLIDNDFRNIVNYAAHNKYECLEIVKKCIKDEVDYYKVKESYRLGPQFTKFKVYR